MGNECFGVWWIYVGCLLSVLMGLVGGFMCGASYMDKLRRGESK